MRARTAATLTAGAGAVLLVTLPNCSLFFEPGPGFGHHFEGCFSGAQPVPLRLNLDVEGLHQLRGFLDIGLGSRIYALSGRATSEVRAFLVGTPLEDPDRNDKIVILRSAAGTLMLIVDEDQPALGPLATCI